MTNTERLEQLAGGESQMPEDLYFRHLLFPPCTYCGGATAFYEVWYLWPEDSGHLECMARLWNMFCSEESLDPVKGPWEEGGPPQRDDDLGVSRLAEEWAYAGYNIVAAMAVGKAEQKGWIWDQFERVTECWAADEMVPIAARWAAGTAVHAHTNTERLRAQER